MRADVLCLSWFLSLPFDDNTNDNSFSSCMLTFIFVRLGDVIYIIDEKFTFNALLILGKYKTNLR